MRESPVLFGLMPAWYRSYSAGPSPKKTLENLGHGVAVCAIVLGFYGIRSGDGKSSFFLVTGAFCNLADLHHVDPVIPSAAALAAGSTLQLLKLRV